MMLDLYTSIYLHLYYFWKEALFPYFFLLPDPSWQAALWDGGFGRGNQKPDSKKIKENLPSLIKLKTTLISIFNL
jgi:hypothetical protein